ncbi:hypothetical protein [Haloarchaeobius amylolyticus]|uniref:hypothetical protein n=1 Tax=Haloarchaeobius amylolyticus TaxID=1198296 RepID=UPI002271832F|nr:hypothetical protein [Haloarchaeobius amylolyticus]
MTADQRRRRFLASLSAVAATGVAGCLGGGAGDGRPTEDPTSTDAATGTDRSAEDTPGTGEKHKDEGDSSTATTRTDPHTVEFESPAGTTVTGTIAGAGNCGVIFVPQIDRDRESWRPQVEQYAAAGHRVLAIDEGEHKTAAVLGAVSYLQDEGIQQLVVVGASSGAEAAVEAAGRELAIDAVAALSPGGGVEAAGSLDARLFVAVSMGDDDRFVDTAERLHEAARGPKRLVRLEGDAHGQGIFETEQGDRLRRLLGRFVTTACGEQ